MQITNIVVARWFEIDVVDFVANRTIAPARHSFLQQLERHIDQHGNDHIVLFDGELVQTRSLRRSAWKTVENITVTTIVLRRALFDESNRQLVGNELSSFHDVFDLTR